MPTSPLIAVVPRGLEKLAAQEIRALGGGIGKTRPARARVHFEGPADALYRANLNLRICERILDPVGGIDARDVAGFRAGVAELPWERLLPSGAAVEVAVSVRACRLFHSGAITDALREGLALRGLAPVPAGATDAPWVTIDVRGTEDHFQLAVDTTGKPLWRRGYRKIAGQAPLRENLAAAALIAAGWTGRGEGQGTLLDPMCGSGTLLAEGARIAAGVASGLGRRFAFEKLSGFDAERWAELSSAAEQQAAAASYPILLAADRARGAIEAARDNLRRAGLDHVKFATRPIDELPGIPGEPGWVVINLPYGHRIDPRDREAVIAQERAPSPATLRRHHLIWGEILKARLPGWTLLVITPEREFAKAMGLPERAVTGFQNGGIPVRVHKGVL